MSDNLIESMDELLVAYGVDLTDPVWRHRKATALVNEGVMPKDAEMVFAHTERVTGDLDKVPAAVAALAKDPARLLEAIPKIVAYRAAQEAREASVKTTDSRPVGIDPRQQESNRGDWARLTNRRVAYARVVADHQPEASVAVEMGIPLEMVMELVSEEREFRAREMPPVKKNPDAKPSPWADIAANERRRHLKLLDGGKT